MRHGSWKASGVIDPRIYRAGFLPALVAVVVVMFSVQPLPDPLQPPISPAEFEAGPATHTASQIVDAAPSRTPGSQGDAAAADLVTQSFSEIEGGEVSEQPFEGSFDGDDVSLRNVILVLRGESERQVVVLASRDSAEGVGLSSSAAATGALVEIAESFGGARHTKTLVFVSTTGGSDGAQGAREFAQSYPDLDLIDAAIVIEQPGAREPQPPHLLSWSGSDESTSIQLVRTAEQAISEQTEEAPDGGGPLGGLFRLALPSGLGEQGALIAEGIDAIGISSAGERPLPASKAGSDSLSPVTLGDYGRAVFSVLVTIDAATDPLEHGPAAYITFSGNLIPGWSLALLAIALVLPAALAAVDAMARAWRQDEGRPRDLVWVISRSLPFGAALLFAYLLAFTGLAPSPSFPFDPGRFEVGWQAAIVVVCLIAALVLVWMAIGPLRVPPGAGREGLAPAAGVVLSGCVSAVWLLNPYLALFLVPAAHAWLAATGAGGPVRRAGVIAALVAALVLPLILAVDLAARLDVGLAVPWQLLLMVTGGQVSFAAAALLCVIAGALVGVVAAAYAPDDAPGAPRIATRGRP
jgi:peptidase M28-like protein